METIDQLISPGHAILTTMLDVKGFEEGLVGFGLLLFLLTRR
jgi:hypothetical protein